MLYICALYIARNIIRIKGIKTCEKITKQYSKEIYMNLLPLKNQGLASMSYNNFHNCFFFTFNII